MVEATSVDGAEELKVGDLVQWSGSWGSDSPKPVTVLNISIGDKSEDNPVESIEWSKVNKTVVVDLSNGHWAYGNQITK
jgi:hypothetical protein